ncbi:hypothetical protein HHI36_018300 [Cryptolaemus montrouzieri]|uniref:Uncharacterized protein n=1 Tax=Cryptolaemus montrouzieri TaxID=559131 RepID=A0ABD2NZP2_9CUCU
MDNLEAAISFDNEVMEELKKSLEDMKQVDKGLKNDQEKLNAEVKLLQQEVINLKGQATNTATKAELHNGRNNLVIFGAQNKQEIVKILGKLKVKVEEERIEVRPIPNNKTEKPFSMPIRSCLSLKKEYEIRYSRNAKFSDT